jgi:hypothetical protein
MSMDRRGRSRWSCRRSWSGRWVRIEETSKTSNCNGGHVREAMATAAAGRAAGDSQNGNDDGRRQRPWTKRGWGRRLAVDTTGREQQRPAMRGTHFAIVQTEDQADLVAVDQLLFHLRRHPALIGVRLPCPCADFVRLGHVDGDGRRASRVGRRMEEREVACEEERRVGGWRRGSVSGTGIARSRSGR